MSSSENTSSTAISSTTHQLTPLEEAFLLETSILRLLLKRHYAQHHRALYFRHLTMTLQCIQRHCISSTSHVTRSAQQLLQARLVEYEHSISRIRKRPGEKEEEDQWESSDRENVLQAWKGKVSPPLPASPLSSISDSTNDRSQGITNSKKILEESLALHAQWLHYTLTKSLPQLQSRIQKTSQFLFQEMAKGYFLPFTSVGIGILSRLRAILMRWGREGVMQCIEIHRSLMKSQISISYGLTQTIGKHCFIDSNIWMKEYMEVEASWDPNQLKKKTPKKMKGTHSSQEHELEESHAMPWKGRRKTCLRKLPRDV